MLYGGGGGGGEGEGDDSYSDLVSDSQGFLKATSNREHDLLLSRLLLPY